MDSFSLEEKKKSLFPCRVIFLARNVIQLCSLLSKQYSRAIQKAFSQLCMIPIHSSGVKIAVDCVLPRRCALLCTFHVIYRWLCEHCHAPNLYQKFWKLCGMVVVLVLPTYALGAVACSCYTSTLSSAHCSLVPCIWGDPRNPSYSHLSVIHLCSHSSVLSNAHTASLMSDSAIKGCPPYVDRARADCQQCRLQDIPKTKKQVTETIR